MRSAFSLAADQLRPTLPDSPNGLASFAFFCTSRFLPDQFDLFGLCSLSNFHFPGKELFDCLLYHRFRTSDLEILQSKYPLLFNLFNRCRHSILLLNVFQICLAVFN